MASTIASPLNGIGMAGVAPKAELVNLRAGQDSGYFFLGPTLDALTYAGDHGIDVVNMSYYIDPWLYNCAANPADSPAEQREQRLVIAATQRAIDYARNHGVTTIAAEGNGHTDLGKPAFDDTSPDYPVDANLDRDAPRTIDNSCKSMPTEADGVIGVTSVGPSGARPTTPTTASSRPTSPPPAVTRATRPTARARSRTRSSPPTRTRSASARTAGDGKPDIDPVTGEPTTPAVIKQGGAYYQYIQGTSMASPHAVGVAALIVAEYGKRDKRNGGVTMDPATGRADPQADRDRPRLPARWRADVPRPARPPGTRTTPRRARARRSATGSTATASSTPSARSAAAAREPEQRLALLQAREHDVGPPAPVLAGEEEAGRGDRLVAARGHRAACRRRGSPARG